MIVKCPKCGANASTRGNRIYCPSGNHWTLQNPKTGVKPKIIRSGVTEFSGFVPRGLNIKELAAYFNIDLDTYRIIKVRYSDREVYRKDHQVDMKWEDGKVTRGKVKDSGDMVIMPLYGVTVFTELREGKVESENYVDKLIEKAKKYSPKVKKIRYKKIKDPVLFEFEMPDLQLGRMVMESETGYELTPDIAVKAARKSLYELMGYAKLFPVGQIIFPIGHDFFNSNNADNKTAHGTPQRDDPRWQRTYRLGRDLLIEALEAISQIAPVEVKVIVGNHDEERMFYLGDTLESWFHNNPNVTVDNSDRKRKFYSFGRCLLGFTHGYWEPLKNLPHLMAVEEPLLWAQSAFREWHVGDKHHQDKTVTQPSKEYPGVTVRILRSLATPSVWEYDKGHLGATRASEAFVFHKEKGQIANFTAL